MRERRHNNPGVTWPWRERPLDFLRNMALLPFLCAKNLTEQTLVEEAPWEYQIPEAENWLKKLSKPKRRQTLLKSATVWNCYTAVKGIAPNLRISKTNPPKYLCGLVADYDSVSSVTEVLGKINQGKDAQAPNFVEVTLSNKIRLVWVFGKPILVPSSEFCQELIKAFFSALGVPTLLAGYDPCSTRPTEMWTNGGVWHVTNAPGLSSEFCFGVVCSVSKKTSLFANGEISLDVIADEVQKRWPGRWQGDFKLDAQGKRFWDEKADNATGCQVKPDGMLCFTGTEPFRKWEQLLGRQWCEEKRILNLGKAGENMLFDGKNYWEPQADKWLSVARVDALLHLTGRGLSNKVLKDATQSDAERVLNHIQTVNRVVGAAPLINYPAGIVDMEGERILNIADMRPVQPVKGATGTLMDFPWVSEFLNGLFPRMEDRPLDHFLVWLCRAYRSMLEHKSFMGQAVFICGPRNNGKTLLCIRIVKPLLGNKIANPMSFLEGSTDFNSELFHAGLLAINDEDSPATEAARRRMNAKLKGLVVNPSHKYHAKFEKPVTIYWTGRVLVTLNDDPGSVGMLPEVEANTKDKMMFFASQPFAGVFPPQDELEIRIATELPAFAWWLLNVYVPPTEVLCDDRMGVKSFFDREILELSHQQTNASGLTELLQNWMNEDAYWAPDQNNTEWKGNPTDLLSVLLRCPSTEGIASSWNQAKIAKSLTALARQEGSSVTYYGDGGRNFVIKKH